MARIAVVGSYGVGMTMRVPRMVEAGETLVAASFDVGPGGKGSNQAIGASRLGAGAELLTCVGPDDFGRAARVRWEEERVGAGKVRTGTQPTMVGLILVEPGGENRIVIAPGALDELTPADVRRFRPEIAHADLCAVVLEIPLDTALEALRVAREVGTPTLLNPAPAVPLPPHARPLIDYLTPNRGEADRLVGGVAGDPEGAVAALRQRFQGTIVLTLGSEGAILAPPGEAPVRVPGERVGQPVDSAGAGDAFNAALAVAIAERRPLPEAVALANRAGAHSVTVEQVIPSLARRDELAWPR